MDLIFRVIRNFREHVCSNTPLAMRGGGEQHESNVFVYFIRFDVMLIHFMDVFSPGEDFRVGLFHFTLKFLTLLGAVEKGLYE